MANEVSFYLNGRLVTVENPPPDLLLIDWLRSSDVRLTGAKKGCGQGGCGACTVILSRWDGETESVVHSAINSCLRPVCALGGLAVTTVEGTGQATRPPPAYMDHRGSFSRGAAPLFTVADGTDDEDVEPASFIALAPQVAEARAALAGLDGPEYTMLRAPQAPSAPDPHEGMNPVAHRLAMNNGTQCGYCSVGWVMAMSALLANHPDPKPTKREIEDNLDGNLCRCTGYRAILTGMKTFASDWTEEDEANRMPCVSYDGETQHPLGDVLIPFPDGAREGPIPVFSEGRGQLWLTPTSLEELAEILRGPPDRPVRLVHGNTSFGVYPDEYQAARVLVDIRLIRELYGIEGDATAIAFGSGTSYTDLLEYLEAVGAGPPTALGAAHFMSRRTAGRMVRNAASIGGNTMLVLEHIHRGEPFPSDLATALVAAGSGIAWLSIESGTVSTVPLEGLIEDVRDGNVDLGELVLLRYFVPPGTPDDIVFAQKVALREVNSHSIVNATTRLEVTADLEVTEAVLVFGGIATYPWRATATEALLRGSRLSLDDFAVLADTLRDEAGRTIDDWPHRDDVPVEGFTKEYRLDLAVSFLYKAIVNALRERGAITEDSDLWSAGVSAWGDYWPVSAGRQEWKSQGFKEPMGQPIIKLRAMYQASGQIDYTHEIELPAVGLNAALVQSRRALATFHYTLPGDDDPISADQLRDYLHDRFDAFVELITHAEIPPHGINLQGIGSDQPLFAVSDVRYVGQSIAMVLADTEIDAIEIAEHVSKECLGYGPVDWPDDWKEPILTLDEAIARGSIYPDRDSFPSHIWKIVRPGSSFDAWVDHDKDPAAKEPVSRDGRVDGRPCKIVESSQMTGGQIHFYMETQACVAEPSNGGRMTVHPSSQSPLEMHQTVAMALGAEHNQVDVNVRQLGGGFGGKTEQARFVAGPVAVAAHATQKPVRMAMKREHDSALIGHRHPYYGQAQVAVDDGSANPDDRGVIRGMHTKMWGDGGAFYDCSFIVSNCIQLRADNAYRIENFANVIDVCRTNTAPNTAMRAFGDVQAMLIIENAIDDAAAALGMSAEEVREKNLYERGDVTPFGQALSYCYMRDVWQYAKDKSAFDAKKREVDDFNQKNRWRKRGIALVPVKYGSGYNLVALEQATAVISVFQADGSIVIHQGGVDMGQGMMTKVEQLASYVLNLPMHLIHVEGPKTSVIPNPSSTGGSTGTAYNGEAVKQACEDLRSRLREFAYQYRDENGDAAATRVGIDFWNYPEEGWSKPVGRPGRQKLIWQNLVALAYNHRVSLVSSFNAKIPGGETPVPALQYRRVEDQKPLPGIDLATNDQGKPLPIGGAVDSFIGFTYSAACAVVEVDVLTGETKIISADLVYDMGWSLNPAIDIGQVEGAFVQGIGYVLTEKVVREPDGPEKGRMNTDNTWRYKPPAVTTIPLELNTYLYPRDYTSTTRRAGDPDDPHGRTPVPESPNGLFSSKEVGEPPLVLAVSVFLALKSAIRASREQRGLDELFRLDAPATVQEVRRALEVSLP